MRDGSTAVPLSSDRIAWPGERSRMFDKIGCRWTILGDATGPLLQIIDSALVEAAP
jgi:hypothetical protein